MSMIQVTTAIEWDKRNAAKDVKSGLFGSIGRGVVLGTTTIIVGKTFAAQEPTRCSRTSTKLILFHDSLLFPDRPEEQEHRKDHNQKEYGYIQDID